MLGVLPFVEDPHPSVKAVPAFAQHLPPWLLAALQRNLIIAYAATSVSDGIFSTVRIIRATLLQSDKSDKSEVNQTQYERYMFHATTSQSDMVIERLLLAVSYFQEVFETQSHTVCIYWFFFSLGLFLKS